MKNATLPLAGKKIGIVVENKFIPEEIEAYRFGFALLGAQVEFISRLFAPPPVHFFSDVDPLDQEPWMTPMRLAVSKDASKVNLDEYAALLMSANYTSIRLRYAEIPKPGNFPPDFDLRTHLQRAPLVQLFAEAMKRKTLIKGFLCHGLWILTPHPDLLQNRTVVCNEVVAADILNCNATIDMNRLVITDGDVITGYSKHEVVPYIQAIADAITRTEICEINGKLIL